ncbi:ABC transporter substrate-binding protein [Prescottella equi]|uniref:Extracellular solute-binding protein n=1 Tax=Rhodococcus hoagii TaxID=43767 RepID=A0A9Q2UXM2_RHOHA|nr:ABC transporter substrate-binding protein [Prescottella equi]MBM4480564.1 extracellular solute-binding protein [Prescottella equi]MBM4491920.1 extracellular solute-binding protein [Prescottella equi]MBM4497877.1 extracellular solute-binding protein [Prescottella equi]MBM4506714.1 extracellular solute-binding protein [Prescottella equi]MBM4514752.1 extracellular solute-binding protein [Prescottella equi]
MRRRTTGLALLSLAAALTVAGCATGATASSSSSDGLAPELDPNQEVEIVFESYNLTQAGPWTDTVTGLIADFEAEHPNITVKAQPPQGTSTAGSGTASSVQTQLLAGNPPDVAQLTFDTLDFAVNQLGAHSLDSLVGTDAVQEHLAGAHPYHPWAATLGDWEGQTYGMPYVFSTPVLFYNASAFQKAGVPADTDLSTWPRVAEAAKKITASTGKPSLTISCAVKGGNWCMQGLFRSAGGNVLSEDRESVEFASDESLAAVEMLRDLYDQGVLANQDSAGQMESFMKGDTAIQLQSSAIQGMLLGASKAAGWELRAAAMPAFDGRDAVPTNSGSALFVFAQDPAKQRAAWELIKFMTSDHAYTEISSKIGYLPLRTSLTTDPAALKSWADGNPLLAPNLKQLDRLEPWQSYPGNSYVQIDDILATAVEESVFYGKDPATTMAAAQKRAQDLIG